ncbi:MAG: type VI secretion system domain-containing protein [Maricaulaceae bacterium]
MAFAAYDHQRLDRLSAPSPLDGDVQEALSDVKRALNAYRSQGPDGVDWSALEPQAETVLTQGRKSFHAMGFLVLAWTLSRGPQGFAEGCALIEAVIDAAPEEVHDPDPMRQAKGLNAALKPLPEWWAYQDERGAFPQGEQERAGLRDAVFALERARLRAAAAQRVPLAQALAGQVNTLVAVLAEAGLSVDPKAAPGAKAAAPEKAIEASPAAPPAVKAGSAPSRPDAAGLEGALAQGDDRVAACLAPIGDTGVGAALEDDPDGPLYAAHGAFLLMRQGDSPPAADIALRLRRALESEAKDVRLAWSLVLFWLLEEGVEGLGKGLAVFLGLVERFGEALHPAEEAARRSGVGAVISAIVERTPRAAPLDADGAPDPSKLTDAQAQLWRAVGDGLARLAQISGSLHPKFDRHWRKIAAAIAPFIAQIPKPEPEPEPEPEPKPEPEPARATAQPAASPTVDPAPASVSTPIEPPSLSGADDLLAAWAREAFEQDPLDPRGYALLRLRGQMRLGFGSAPDWSMVREPDEDDLARLNALARQASTVADDAAAQRLADCDIAAADLPYWLDHHAALGQALEVQGERGAAALNVVAAGAAFWLQRFPDLAKARFESGRPTASPETLTWLARFGGGAAPADAVETFIDDVRPKVGGDEGDAAQAKAVDAALARLLAPPFSDARSRFRAGLAAAEAAAGADRLDLAMDVLLGLQDQARRFELSQWEPQLAAQAFGDFLDVWARARSQLRPEPLQTRRQVQAADALAALAGLDPGRAAVSAQTLNDTL